MIRKIVSTIAICTMILTLGACSKGDALQIGDKAPEFSKTDLDGKIVNLADLKGNVVIIDFFASWCPPCREEIPDFIALQARYASEKFTMIGVSLVSFQETKKFSDQLKINYPLVVDDQTISRAYGPIRSIPTTFIIDKTGAVAKIYIGYRPKEVFEADIQKLLK